MKKYIKRIIALLLVVIMATQNSMTIVAKAGKSKSGSYEVTEMRNVEILTSEGRPVQDTEPVTGIAKEQQQAQKESSGGNVASEIYKNTVNQLSELFEDMEFDPSAAVEMADEMANKKMVEGAVEQAAKYRKYADKVTDISEATKMLSDFFGGFSKLLDVATLINDIHDMNNLENQRLLTQIVEYVLVWADLLLLILGVLNLIGFPWSLILGLIVALFSDIVKSDWFKDWANNSENGVLDGAEDWARKLSQQRKTPDNVGALKPNIYIYSDTPKNVTVTFQKPELLTISIPEYLEQWTVTTGTDGIVTMENGDTYDYLFYESVTQKRLFQTEAGYRIPAAEREETFRKILVEMGFNQKEINDFVEFWVEKLPSGVDYIMYPQETARVDLAMPMNLSVETDAVTRIWFAFESDAGQKVSEPERMTVNRDSDYYVVEWGGMIFD